jgi:hypothetical protein
LISYRPVGAMLVGLGAVIAALGILSRLWPRPFGVIGALCLLGFAGFYAAMLWQTDCLWTAPLSLVMLSPAAAGVSVTGLLFARRPALAWASAMPSAIVTVCGVAAAVAGASWLTEYERLHRAPLEIFGSRMATALEHANETAAFQIAGSPPVGARGYVREWIAASGDQRAKAKLLSGALGLRTVPCQAIRSSLPGWRAKDARSFGELARLLHDGLFTCPFAGVDVDALEYVVLLPFER